METVKGPDSPERMLEHMVDLYQLPLLRLCYAYLHDEELAKDAVQETFIKAYRNLNRFDRRSSEKSRCFAGSRVLRIWKRLKPWEYPIRLSAAV